MTGGPSRPARPHLRFTEEGRRVREVLTYSRRGSRLTPRQAAAWEAHADAWVIPDEVVDNKRTIKLGGTTLDLLFTGRNHSDSSLVMFLPKEKIVFMVDFNSLGAVPSRLAVNDSYPTEWEASLKKILALNWDRQIPGHPGPGGRLGTKKDMEEQLAFMTALNDEVKKASDAGKCFDPASKEVRVPQFGSLQGYEANIEWNIHRWCGYWGRGI